MKHVFGNLCRASVAAVGVLAVTPAASAETRPLEFETEFDLGIAGEAIAAALESNVSNISAAATQWEQSIGAYLDGLLEAAAPALEPAPASGGMPVSEVVDAEVEAFAPVELAPPVPQVNPLPQELLKVLGDDAAGAPALSLAPAPSHPTGCAMCEAAGEWVEITKAEAAPSPAEGMVDDGDAWQRLAEWASARLAAEDAAADDEFEALLDDGALAD